LLDINRECGDNTEIKINATMASILLKQLVKEKHLYQKDGAPFNSLKYHDMAIYIAEQLKKNGIDTDIVYDSNASSRRKIFAYVDGGALNNGNPDIPNISVCAYIVRDDKGNELARCGRHIGNVHNTIAEYHAILDALRFMIANGLTENPVVIYSDAKVVVDQVNMICRTRKTELRHLRNSIIEMMNIFKNVKVQYIPREKNDVSDKFASDMLSFITTGEAS
jgi:ribonuclease HI